MFSEGLSPREPSPLVTCNSKLVTIKEKGVTMGKFLRYITIGILIMLIIGGGAAYIAYKLNLFAYPEFIAKIPLVGERFGGTETAVTVTNKEDPLILANEKLSDELADFQDENEQLKEEIEQNELLIQELSDKQIDFQEEIANLNMQLLEERTTKAGIQAAYKDLAVYFSEMKAKDAADILSKLSDDDIIGIITEMEPDLTARILQLMDHNRSATIAKKMLVVSPQ